MARRWVKLWVAESLRGTIRFDFSPAERGVWYDLLMLAGDSRQDGLIAPSSGVAYPLKWVAGTLNISLNLLQKTLEICKKSTRIEVNGSGIRILNWQKYQSEYERQKPFRYKKVTNKVTQKLPVEVEEEIEIDKEEDKDIPLIPPVSLSLTTKEVITAYQENILLGGTVNEEMEYELSAACARYSQVWVMDAIREALAQNQPFWRYIVGILKNWQRDGKPSNLIKAKSE